MGKSLTGGTLSLAATLCQEHIAETIASSDPGALMHGPTFMGNPLACAAALASLDLLEREPWKENVSSIEKGLRQGLEACRTLPGVSDVRVLGAIGVVELEQPVDMQRVQPAFVDQGVWIRPFGRLVYTMPPFITDPTTVETICEAIYQVISAHGPD